MGRSRMERKEVRWGEDAEGRCLKHRDHIHGKEPDKNAAVLLATAMIRDGRLPTPEAAKQCRKDRLERRRQRPSEQRRRQEQEEEARLYAPKMVALSGTSLQNRRCTNW